MPIERPTIENLRFVPEDQTEQDDETTIEFDIRNNNREIFAVIYQLTIEAVPASGVSLPFPGIIQRMHSDGILVKVLWKNTNKDNLGTEIRIDPASKRRFVGILETKTALGAPGSTKYPYPYSMKIEFEWMAQGAFKEAGANISHQIKPD